MLGLSIRYTFLAWSGLGPRFIPKRALGDHLGREDPLLTMFDGISVHTESNVVPEQLQEEQLVNGSLEPHREMK